MDDTPVDLANAKVYYESSDINVAEVTDTGEITAKSAGSAEISAYVEAEGVVCYGKCLIQVRDSSSLAGFTLGPDTLLLEPFSSSWLVPDGVMTSGYKADFSNADITYEIVESNPADTVAVADNGRITGIRAGHAKVRAKVNAAGTEHISNEVDIEVRARDDINRIVMDFVGYQATGNARSATLETDGWRINPDLSSAYVGGLSNGYLFQSFGFQAQVNSANTPRASDTAIDFLARKPGYYSFFFRGGNYANGALAAVYVNGRYMGQYDFNNNRAGVIYGTLAEMNSVYLEEGINSVIIRSIGTTDPSGTGFQHYPGLMAFHYLDELPGIDEVELSLTRARLAVGERTSYSTKVVTADGREVRFGNLLEGGDDPFCSQTVISNNPSVLRVNDDGTVSALSEGIAEITLTAVVGSETKTDSVDVIVDGTAATGINVELENSLLYSGDTSRILTSITLSDGRIIRGADVSYSFTGSNESVFKVTGDRITAVGVGSATLTATALFQGKTLTKTLGVTVTEDGFETVQLSAVNTILGEDSPGEQLIVTCLDNNGQIIDMSDAIISYGSDNEQVVTVNQNGWVTPVGVGSAYITAEVSIGNISRSGGMFVSVSRGKKASTFYTAEKVEAAHENISKYSWARTQMQSARNKADKYVDKAEQLWNMVTSQGIPRSIIAGLYADPEGTVCRYCGADLRNKYFVYPWITNPLTSPWKIQCPDCKRKFPSNDFAGFYELGLDEQRIFDVNRAHERNNELVEQGKPGYLKNMLYPEKGEGWGVDDGFGYKTGKVWANGVEEVHAYIAYYHHWGVWYRTSYASNAGLFLDALESLTNAYLFTGESKYGRTGAIVLDRIADVYPGFKISDYKEYSHANTYGDGLGRILGREWEPMLVKVFLGAYDAFFPVYDDPYVVRFLRDKAAEMGLVNDKSNPSKIRENIETNFIREVAKACKDKDIYSNFGTHQSAMALAALVLDSSPDTEEWMDWIMRAPLPQSTDAVSGGDVLPRILESVDRDGHGLEVSPGYNYGWLNSLLEIADAMEGYNDENANIYQHPRIRQMLISMLPLTINRRVTLPIGHSGRTASKRSLTPTIDTTMKGFLQTGDIRAAQLIYFLNGNSTKNLRAGIFTKDPENVANDIQKIIDEYGEYDFDRSEQLPAYGFSILRRGGLYESDTGDDDTQHSIYMTHGITLRHGNNDSLNIGIQAYGLELTPDLGYGVNTTDVSVKQWIDNTLSHNTVMVNQSMQSKLAANGNPMHFDDDGFVAVMDAETPKAYPLVVKDYRRTVVMVKANDEVSYGVDFFRVRGGDDHLYSFHAQSDEITDVKGLNLIEQPMGTYAGAAVPYGPDTTQPIGFSWLNHVRRSPAHGSNGFSVEFKIKDFNRALNKTQDIRLRMTMPAGLYLDEVSLARGYPPQRAENNSIPYFEYVLARRKGKDLDTLFTTTFEPYRDKPYLKDIEIVSAERISGKVQPGDEVRAVKVTHLSGRVDYIIYATNNTVLYRIADLFDFRGFVGVYSLDGDGNPIYSYIQDGDVLADTTAVAAATGKVYDFTKSLSLENSLTLTVDQQIDPEDLVGRFVCIENDGAENAVYEIIGAELAEDGKLLLDVGRA
ncbi:MAG: hypothetical protein GX541_06470, partial [Clostridiales bacterium]|nr:hypothetical protein [Clostridiales bacterium]